MNKLGLYLRGIFMGAADIIPGVSGGSIALITGIYSDLIEAIHSVNLEVVKDIFSGKIVQGIKKIHWGFILPVLFGILTALFTMARVMSYVLTNYELYTWSMFFGLILASVYVIGKQIKWSPGRVASLICGIVSAFFIVGAVPVETPTAYWFIFISGMIAICAMILPGISGAFLLLIMGKYHYITDMLHDPFVDGHYVTLLVFACGCVAGVLSFSRVLKWVLDRWHAGTLAFLTGMMFGSLRKIWPYKEAIDTTVVDGKTVVLKETLIAPWNVSGSFVLSLVFIVIGICVIVVIDKVSGSIGEE